MQASLGALTVDLIANTAGFERGMNQAERALQRQEKAADRLAASIDPVTGAMQKLTAQQIKLDELWQKKVIPDQEYKRLSGILAENEKALKSTGDQITKTNAALSKSGLTAKQLANNLRGVPAQFTDIAVSLQAGQAPLTVLLQQGGQLKDMFGGIGPAASALGGYIVGLINPFTVLAATLGTITALFIDAEKEASAFNKALFSGSASSGQTASSLDQLAKDAAVLTGRIGEARQAVIALAGSTGLSETQFRNLALAATAIGEFTGKGAADIAKSLGDLGDNATVAAQKISAQYGLITNEQYEVIKALDIQGKKQEALDVLSATLAENAQARLKTYRASLSDLERDWDDIGTAISNAYSKVRGELFPDAAKQIELLERILQTRKEGGVAGAISTGLGELATTLGLADETTDALEKQLALLKQAETSKKAAAESDGKALRANQALIKADAERMKAEKSAPAPKAFREDAGQKMLDTLRQQAAALQVQSDTTEKLGAQAKALAAFEQQIADIKNKDITTADQKSLLASEDLLRAQLKRNVALEQEVAARKQATDEAGKLAAFQENQASKLNTAQEGLDSSLAGLGSGDKLRERLKEDLAIRKEYQGEVDKLNAQFNKGQISEELFEEQNAILEEALATRLVMQQDYYNQLDEAAGSFFLGASESWNNYLTEATDVAAQTQTLFNGAFSGLTDALYGFVTTGKLSFQDLAASFAQTALKMLIQYAAAQAIAAGLNAFTSTAAIPVVGPIAAPAAAASALAYAGGLSASIASIAGMAHDGIDSVPQTGTWLLQKGERVTTAQTSAKLDKTLDTMKSPSGSSGTTVNVIEDASKAGQTRTRLDDDGVTQITDVFVSQIYGDGPIGEAMQSRFGLRGQGV